MTTTEDLIRARDVPDALEYFKPPFKYEAMGQTIYCEGANGQNMCLQVRGWGNLIGGGANNLHPKHAQHIQDEFGQWVCDAMNASITPPSAHDAAQRVDVVDLKHEITSYMEERFNMPLRPHDCMMVIAIVDYLVSRNLLSPSAPVVPAGWLSVKDRPLYTIKGDMLEIVIDEPFLCAVPTGRDTWDIAYVEIDGDCDLVYSGAGDTFGWTMQDVAFYRSINMPDAPPSHQQSERKKHVASPDCWCEPEEDEPGSGLFIHKMMQ